MRLIDLEPRFLAYSLDETGHEIHRHLPNAIGAQGIRFTCPNPRHGHIIVIWFANPVDAAPVPNHVTPTPRWTRTGMTYETLSLTPSIDVKDDWHGFVTDGEVRGI